LFAEPTPKPADEPKPVAAEPKPAPAPLKEIEKLSDEELEKVFKRLPEAMQKAEEPTISFAFKTDAESIPFPEIDGSVKKKIFPPPPKNDAEVAAKLKARLERENAKQREREEERRRQEDAKALEAANKAAKKAAEEAAKAEEQQRKELEKAAKKEAQMAKELEEAQRKEAERAKKEEEKKAKDEAKRLKELEELAEKQADQEMKENARRQKEAEKARLAAEAQAARDAELSRIFAVTKYMPSGLQSLLMPKVRITFNHKIANAAGDALQWSPVWSPTVPKGKWVAEDDHTILFNNDEAWPNSTRYTVSVRCNRLLHSF
jgi:hypothetical protein